MPPKKKVKCSSFCATLGMFKMEEGSGGGRQEVELERVTYYTINIIIIKESPS